MNEIDNTFNQILAEKLGVESPNELHDEAEFEADLNADPATMAEVVGELERQFEIELTPEELRTVTTVGELRALVLDQLGEVA